VPLVSWRAGLPAERLISINATAPIRSLNACSFCRTALVAPAWEGEPWQRCRGSFPPAHFVVNSASDFVDAVIAAGYQMAAARLASRGRDDDVGVSA